MKKLLNSLILMVSFCCMAQEPILEFTTSHVQITGFAIEKSAHQFQLFSDKLVLHYKDKNVLKLLEKQGVESSITMPYSFTKKVSTGISVYEFQNNEVRILITVQDGLKSPIVKMTTKDNFTGATSEAIYITP